jgi:hypothetical protein
LFSAIAWAGLGGGCGTVLGLEGYKDAPSVLCECPGFENFTTCAELANERLTAATVGEREAWLAAYDARQCGTNCERAAECYGDLPGCPGKKPGCECCVWNTSVIECNVTACQTCRTCSEMAIQQDDGVLPCVSSRARLATLEACACMGQCTSDCTGFCQGFDLLSEDLMDGCRACVETNCQDAVAACLADQP